MDKYQEFARLKTKDINNALNRLDLSLIKDTNEAKLEYIFNEYKSKEIYGYLLYDYELEFLRKHINDNNIEPNFITYQLKKILILVGDETLKVNPYIKASLIKGIDYYFKHKKEIDDTKYIVYFVLGILRLRAIVSLNTIHDYIRKCFNKVEDVSKISNLIFIHPLFNRFARRITKDRKAYCALIEVEGTDREIMTYLDPIDPDFSATSLINIGKYYLDIDSSEFKNAISNLGSAMYFNKVDRAELIYKVGYSNYLEFISNKICDRNTLEIIDSDPLVYNTVFDYIINLPSFYPCNPKSIFIKPFNYDIASAIVTGDEINVYELPSDDMELVLRMDVSKLKKYYVYCFKDNKVVLLDIEKEELVYIKSNRYSGILNSKSLNKVINTRIIEYNGFLTPVLDEKVKIKDKELLLKYKSICEKLMKNK